MKSNGELKARIAELEHQQAMLVGALRLANTNSREPADEPWRLVVKATLTAVKPAGQKGSET